MKLYQVKGVLGAGTPPLMLEDLPILTDGNSKFADPQDATSVSADVGAFIAANKSCVCCLDHEIDLALKWWDFDNRAWKLNPNQASGIAWHLKACELAAQTGPRGFGFWSYSIGYNPLQANYGDFEAVWRADLAAVAPVYSHPAVTHLFPSFYCPSPDPMDWLRSNTLFFTALQSFRKPLIPFVCPYFLTPGAAYGQYVGDTAWRFVLDLAADTCGAAALWLNQIPFATPQWLDILARHVSF